MWTEKIGALSQLEAEKIIIPQTWLADIWTDIQTNICIFRVASLLKNNIKSTNTFIL